MDEQIATFFDAHPPFNDMFSLGYEDKTKKATNLRAVDVAFGECVLTCKYTMFSSFLILLLYDPFILKFYSF